VETTALDSRDEQRRDERIATGERAGPDAETLIAADAVLAQQQLGVVDQERRHEDTVVGEHPAEIRHRLKTRWRIGHEERRKRSAVGVRQLAQLRDRRLLLAVLPRGQAVDCEPCFLRRGL
jgi:hypothetical protein